MISSGIWMCLLLLAALSIIAASVMLVGANVANLICHPLEDPLARPDILSVLMFFDAKISTFSYPNA